MPCRLRNSALDGAGSLEEEMGLWANQVVSGKKELFPPMFVGGAFWEEALAGTKSLRRQQASVAIAGEVNTVGKSRKVSWPR